MITIDIPGFGILELNHLVLDYNGTLAVDGELIRGVKEKLKKLKNNLSLYVITADTFGKAAQNMEFLDCQTIILQKDNQQSQKDQFIRKLGKGHVVAIGNGRNDASMLKSAALGIAVIQEEGASPESLVNADVICKSVNDALNLLIEPLRLIATLRN